MKSSTNSLKANFATHFYALCFVLFGIGMNGFAQQLPECDANVPFFIIDLSSNPDSTYTTPEIIRQEQCCGDANNQNYVSFYVTLHPDVAMIEIGIAPGYADPGGSGNYNIISGGDLITPGTCGANIPGGQTACITGVGPHKITYHKPGGNKVKYYLRQIPMPIYPADDTTRVGCSLPMDIYGLDNITINSINSSTGVTTSGAFNSLLSCTNCANPSFNPGLATPDWIDYEICGTPQASACGVYQACDTVRLYTADVLEVLATPNPGEFCSGGSILLNSSATGGDGNYTFNWFDSGGNNISATSSYLASSAGTFTAEVMDGLTTSTCPAEYISIPVTVGLPPTVNAGPDQTVCAQTPEVFLAGSVDNATGGTWSGGAGIYDPSGSSLLVVYTPTQAEILAGSVTMTLTSTGAGGGCTDDSDQMTIFFSDTVVVAPSYVTLACNGDATTIDANASGGTAPFIYSWSTGESTSSISATAGTYSVTVEDIYRCATSATINVVEPSTIILSMSSTNTSTDLACDGTATVSISGGVGPYTVEWMDLQTTLTATGLCYGIATVTVTDALGCTATGSVVINNPTCSAFNVTATNTDVDCFGDDNAQAFSFPSGGTPSYTYSWNTAPVQTTQNATGLEVGTYTVTVTDNLGCIDVASVTVTQPTVITNTMTHLDATSIGGNEGSATANPAGGTSGYTYSWNPTAQATQTAINLTEGVYYVNILDGNGCLKVDSVQINQPPCNDFMLAVNTTDITCNGLTNGEAYIVIAQGTPPYSIVWSSGQTDVTSVTELAAGSYTVTVTDASNCTTFETFDIVEPNVLNIGLVPTNISCYGANDGTIDLTVSGGTFPYSYTWYMGASSIANHEDLVNLAPGTYSIEVMDANNCTVQGSAGISQPELLSASYTYSDILCYGSDDGSVNTTVIGGTLPYGYIWTGPNGFIDTQEDISGLELGLYELQIIDGNGCNLSTTMQSYINEPDSVKLVSYLLPCPVPGANDVVVTVDSLSGGLGEPYEISFDGGLTYGTPGDYSATLPINTSYNVMVMDPNGCLSPDTTTINIDPKVEVTDVTFDPCVSVGTTMINVTVTPSGGDSGPYEVSTDGGATFNTAGTYVISLPVAASYSIVVRDGKGCLSTEWLILIPAEFEAIAVLTTEASCPGATDGAIDLTITGGTTPYTIAWTGPAAYTSAMEDISGLIAGTYDVTITDDSSCVFNTSMVVTTTPDITPPTITFCSGGQNEIADIGQCSYTLTGTAWDVTATDDCIVASIVYNLAGATTGTGTSLDGVIFNLGTTTVTWTVTDGSGNISTCIFDVVVTDTQLPAITSCGASGTQNVVVDLAACTFTVSGIGWDATATDNCTVSTIAYTLTGVTSGSGTSLDGVAFNLGTTTVLWTVTDGVGNSDFCTFDVVVTDTQLPAITSCGATGTQNVVVDGGLCSFTFSGTGWDATATDNCTVSTIEYTLSGVTTGIGTSLDGVTFNLGTTTVTWTVIDGSGNSDFCTFDVVVTDTQLPAITSCGPSGDQTVNANIGTCTYTYSGTGWDAIATDNCTVSTIVYTLSGVTTGTGTSLDGVAFNLGVTTVTWTATDGAGNTATCSFLVTVLDDQTPSILSCGAAGTQNVSSDLDLCTYTHLGTAWDAAASDNCSVASVTYSLTGATTGTGSSLDGVTFNLGTTTVIWTATDGSGNTNTCTFDVVVTDSQLPAIISCGASGTQNVVVDAAACTFTVSGTAWDATATDNCTVSTIIYTLSGASAGTGISLDGIAFNLGTTTVTWTVTDGVGNTNFCTFDVVVTDTQLPAITSCGASGTQNVVVDAAACTFTVSGTAWDATATDNCTVSSIIYTLSGATTGTGISLDGVVFNLGITTVTWTVTDGVGNTDFCTFDVVVTDTQLPAITSCGPSGDQTVYANIGTCTYTYSGTGWDALATDNCTVSTIIYTMSGATTGTGTSLNGVAFNLGITTVTWTVTDGSGNTVTCSFLVTVLDDQSPSILSCGATGTQNVSSDLGVCTYTYSGTAWDATASDNCSVASVAYSLSGATTGSGTSLDGVTFAQGTTTVTWTATDGSGNTVSCTFDVIVTDNEVPSVIGCLTTISVNNDTGDCGADVSWIPPTFTDNCGATMTSTHNSGDFFPIGSTTVTYTVTDGTGNISICTFDVVVTDSELPQMTCPSDVASCDSLVTFTTPTATDNCGVVSVTQVAGLPSGSFFPVGTTTVSYEALDVNGNIFTCSFDVTIYPTPILSTQSTDVTCFGDGDGSIDLTVTNGTVPYTFAWSNLASTEDISGLQPGTYSVTAEDANGCMASIQDQITQPELLLLNKEVSHVNCYGGTDGAIDLTITGGILPYTFAWSNSAITEDLSGLSAGTYSVVVMDANNCEVTDATIILQPDSISIQSVVTGATCNAPNGSINTQVTGGVSPYTFAWSDGSTDVNLTNVIGGMYTLTVTDANNCTATITDSVGTTSNIGGYIYVNDVACNGGDDGSALAIMESGNTPYTYVWSTGDTLSEIEGLVAGSYSVNVIDAFGCEITLDFEINEPEAITVDLYSPTPLDGFNVSLYGGADGSIQTSVDGGVEPYSYDWSNGGSSDDLNGLPAGNYSVIVTDANGCSVRISIELIQPLELAMPEGVSPNNDGDNDFFVIKGIEAYPDNELIIYNRWGNIVYQIKGYNNDWHGENKKGEPLPDGTYFVIFKPTGSGDVEPLTGYIDLRRSR
ncbi:MAG: HYR domain-containing protein [Crocinitomicaceae bacterium]|nr:HYR domain-containing protein [Crocinitomicaceae bacterium]